MSSRVTMQLKNSKASEIGPEAIEQVFTSLPETLKFPWNLIPIKDPDPFAFEIITLNQTTSFQVNVPEEYAHYVKSQLIAAYPEITIEDTDKDHHTLAALLSQQLAISNIKLTHGSFYPLKTYADFPETDPLSALLGTLSKLAPQQSALIQILVAPVSDGWKKRGYAIAGGSTNADGTVTPNPNKDLIETKLGLVCHLTAITIATGAIDKPSAEAIMNNITGSFATITDAKSNSLTRSKPLMGLDTLIESLPHRNFRKTERQYFSVKELATIFHMPFKDIKDIKNISWGKTLLGEPPENLPTHAHTPPEELDHLNLFGKTEYKNETQIFGIKDNDRRRHMYIIGKSGTGKSTLLGNMIINDIKHGKGLAVIDPHGDLVETVLDYIPANRINDVIYLNPADPEYTVRLNLLEQSGQQFRELIASGVIAIFKKLYSESWGPRLEHILRISLLTLVEKDQATMEDIIKILTNDNFRQRTVQQLHDPVLINFWTKEWVGMGQRMQGEAVAPILNKIGQFVSSPLIRHVINSPTSSFSIEEAMNTGKIVLCNMSQGKLGEDNATLLGAMLITKIQLSAMNRVYIPEEERRDFILYVDEFQNFATSSFIKILSEARKYRLSLILANQYVEQIDPDIRAAIFGNCGSLITFLVGAGDAALLSLEFGQQYTPEDLVSIVKHQIVLKLMVDGTQSIPFPAYTLSPASSTNHNREKVIQVSRERYAKKKIDFSKQVSHHEEDDHHTDEQPPKGGRPQHPPKQPAQKSTPQKPPQQNNNPKPQSNQQQKPNQAESKPNSPTPQKNTNPQPNQAKPTQPTKQAAAPQPKSQPKPPPPQQKPPAETASSNQSKSTPTPSATPSKPKPTPPQKPQAAPPPSPTPPPTPNQPQAPTPQTQPAPQPTPTEQTVYTAPPTPTQTPPPAAPTAPAGPIQFTPSQPISES